MGIKKMIALGMTMVLMSCAITGCGKKGEENKGTSTSENSAPTVTQAPEKKEETVTISVFVPPSKDKNEKFNQLLDDFMKAEPNIKVKKVVVPGEGGDMYQKIDVSVMSGDETDLIPLVNNIFENKYASSGLLAPLNEIAEQNSYDLDKVYGKYLVKYENDTVYSIPDYASMWAVYYNRKIFDDAQVSYPTEAWTWDDFVETAKKLNNPEKGIYGVEFLQYDTMSYLSAIQNEIPAYKEDGTSNYDHPLFKESLQFYNDVTNTYKLAPSWLEFKTKKLNPMAFFTGNYGMIFAGSFMLDYVANDVEYPRDFATGIVQTPSAGPDGNNNLISLDFYGINNNSKHKDEAFKLATYLGENMYKALGLLPARVDLTEDQMNEALKGISDSSKGQFSTNELNKAFFDNGMGVVSEKITGIVASEFKANLLREAELYYVGEKSVDDAVADIKKSTDEAIKAKNE